MTESGLITFAWHFTIFGRGVGRPLENAIPYKRTTQRAKTQDQASIEYEIWKGYVRQTFEGRYPDHQHILVAHGSVNALMPFDCKNISKNGRYLVQTKMWFMDETHGDPDNVTKGILDAIFIGDKRVLSQTLFYDYDENKPRVEVYIEYGHKDAFRFEFRSPKGLH